MANTFKNNPKKTFTLTVEVSFPVDIVARDQKSAADELAYRLNERAKEIQEAMVRLLL